MVTRPRERTRRDKTEIKRTQRINYSVGAALVKPPTFEAFFANKVLLHIRRHVELERKREMRVDFFLHHRQHVERVTHRVEAQNHWQLLETCPGRQINHSLTHTKN